MTLQHQQQCKYSLSGHHLKNSMKRMSQYLNSSQIQASFEPKKYAPIMEPKYSNDLKASGRMDFVKASQQRQFRAPEREIIDYQSQKKKEPQNETILFSPKQNNRVNKNQDDLSHNSNQVVCPQCGCKFDPSYSIQQNYVQNAEQREYVPSPQLRSPNKASLLQPKSQEYQIEQNQGQNQDNNNQNYKFIAYLTEKEQHGRFKGKQASCGLAASEFQILLQEYMQQHSKQQYIDAILPQVKLSTQQYANLLQFIPGDDDKIKLVVKYKQQISDLQDKIIEISRLLTYKSNIPKMKKQLGI